MRRLTWPTLRRDGRSPFVLHSFTHPLVLAGLLSAQAAARHLCRKRASPITRRPFHTHLCLGKNYFCTGQAQGLYPESAVPNCPLISHMVLARPFHTFLLWKKFFLHRASPSTLPGGGRSHVVHSFYTCFSSGGARFCTGRARQLDPVTAILPLIHSFLHVFVLAKTFSRQSNP